MGGMTNNLPPSKKCFFCNKEYFKKINTSKKSWTISRFCSKECRIASTVGSIPWNKGLVVDRNIFPTMGHFQKHSAESLKKITDANIKNAKKRPPGFFRDIQKLAIKSGLRNGSYKGKPGTKRELNPNWLGENASYNSKHRYIQNNWPKTGVCQKCGSKPPPFGKRRYGTEWHNTDGLYNRDHKETWIEVCSKCHKKYDR